jgi:hypothetical protein
MNVSIQESLLNEYPTNSASNFQISEAEEKLEINFSTSFKKFLKTFGILTDEDEENVISGLNVDEDTYLSLIYLNKELPKNIYNLIKKNQIIISIENKWDSVLIYDNQDDSVFKYDKETKIISKQFSTFDELLSAMFLQ